MNKSKELREEHFANLKSQYQSEKYENSSPSSLLYLILRKANIGSEITDLEFAWLKEHELFETIKIIEQDVEYRAKEIKNLVAELVRIQSKYAVIHRTLDISSPLYSILVKLDSENKLTNSELEWTKQNNLVNIADIAIKMEHFAELKTEYKATQYQDSSPDSRLYGILKQLEAEQRLSDSDVHWLKQNELLSTLEIFQQQEKVREDGFAQLKDKYQATKNLDTSVSSPLYVILQKLDLDNSLSNSEIEWLKEHELTETIAIVDEREQKRIFASLKIKYKATQFEDLSLSSHLYKILKKLELDISLPDSDINFLKKRQLNETINIALDKYAAILKLKIESGEQLSEADIDWLKRNERENIITLGQEKHFANLKSKYNVSDYKDKSPTSLLYAILQKLERLERLEPKDVAWLEENKTEGYHSSYSWSNDQNYGGRKLFYGMIFTTYHKIEATFYEQEYNSTGSKWNLPNASSHWRKAEQPKKALKLTADLDFDKIKENKLKSALLTTRGGAFRDIGELDNAEKCARKAIEYQPNSHHPYTLMGAIYFERGEYYEGEKWFAKAIERGASPRDQDAEIKRIVKNSKDKNKQREVVEYLLRKDHFRYAWAKSYRK